MAIILSKLDDESRNLALDLLAGQSLLDQTAIDRQENRLPPIATASELGRFIAGDMAQQSKIERAIRFNVRCRRLYRDMLAERSTAYVPSARAAASPSMTGPRAFKARIAERDVPGQIDQRPSEARPGRIYLTITIASNQTYSGLALDVPEDHPRCAELAGLQLQFEPPLQGRIEVMKSADAPILAGLADPAIGIFLIPA